MNRPRGQDAHHAVTPDPADAPVPPGEGEDLRRKLIFRAIAAALAIVALVAGLALFEQGSRTPPAVAVAPPPAAPEPPAAEPPKPEPPAIQPASGSLDEPKPADAKPEEAAPERSGAPEAPAAPSAKPEPSPARPTEPAKAPAHAKTAPPAPVEARPSERPVAAPTPPPPTPAPVAPRAEPRPPIAGAGYAVQAGIFSNPANAEELRAKLTLNGIPSQIEVRVLAGPFATAQEARQAQEKLRALGVATPLLVPPKGR